MNVLQLTVHLYPNVGGVETHLKDLTDELVKRGFNVVILSYRPLTTECRWKVMESKKRLTIYRIPWIPGLFYSLVKNPILQFLYLSPGLFLFTPFIIIFKNIDIIHAHGLVAGVIGVFWTKILGKKIIISLHSIYHFPAHGLYRDFVSLLFKHADCIFGLSSQSVKEALSLGILADKAKQFTYWINLKKFKEVDGAKKQLNLEKNFITLFVGRLVKEKGINELLESAKLWNNDIRLLIIGSGPLEDKIKKTTRNFKNIDFLGKISQERLPIYYSAADLLIVPSTHEEGFGRVMLESLACSTPVIGANRGAIPEAIDKSVGMLINVNPKNIKAAVERLYRDRKTLKELSKNSRKFAERRYSSQNVEAIIKAYRG